MFVAKEKFSDKAVGNSPKYAISRNCSFLMCCASEVTNNDIQPQYTQYIIVFMLVLL